MWPGTADSRRSPGAAETPLAHRQVTPKRTLVNDRCGPIAAKFDRLSRGRAQGRQWLANTFTNDLIKLPHRALLGHRREWRDGPTRRS